MRFNVQQRVLFVKTYFENGSSLVQTLRALRGLLDRKDVPSKTALFRIVKKFEETGSVMDRPMPLEARRKRSTTTIEAVRVSVEDNPETSTRHRAQEVGVCHETVRRILRDDLHLFPYKIQLTQELKFTDHKLRRRFVKIMFERMESQDNFVHQIIFSDEAHFHLNGFVNKQNSRFWTAENPRQTLQVPLHCPRVTVWCGFWSGGVIGPFFFQDSNGNPVNVNGERYRSMLREFLGPECERLGLQSYWFQQDGASPHTADETIDLVKSMFPRRVISRKGTSLGRLALVI